ncbi:chaplin [Streptomyces sp. NPDC059851]|uniref:chaplin n=1 Tax=Streptomyces sp. NPDC059851 TaxID=3346971 RepID=UPI003647C465
MKKTLARGTTVAAAGAAVLMGGAGPAAANDATAGAIPIDVCGNAISVVGFLDPAFGNVCVNR